MKLSTISTFGLVLAGLIIVIHGENVWNEEYECGVIWNYHIGKTGGNNLKHVMRRKLSAYSNIAFKDVGFQFSGLNSNFNKSYVFYNELISYLEDNLHGGKILYIDHHHRSYGFNEFISDGLYQYIYSFIKYEKKCNLLFTVLFREPIQHTLSILAFDDYHLNNDEKNINQAKYAINNRFANYQIGYLNYNIMWELEDPFNDKYCINNKPCLEIAKMDKINLNKSILSKTFDILSHFDIIGFTDKYNQFLMKIYDIIFANKSLIYNKTNEFDKEMYKKHVNKLSQNKQINDIPTDILKLIINTHSWDFKLYYLLKMIDDEVINGMQIKQLLVDRYSDD